MAASDGGVRRQPARPAGAVATTTFGVDVTRVGWPTGSSLNATYQQDLQAFNGNLGSYCKHFSASDWQGALDAMNRMYAGAPPGPWPVLCAKVHTDASLQACLDYFGGLGVPWVAVYWQEPQDDILSGALTALQYRSTIAAMAGDRAAHPHGNLMNICVNNSAYPLFAETALCAAKGCDAVPLASGLPVDVISFDHYWQAGKGVSYESKFLLEIQQMAEWGSTLGKPVALTEFGIATTVPNRAQMYQDVIDQLRALNFRWANEWEGGATGGQSDFRLQNDPTALAVWTAAMSAGISPRTFFG